MGHIGFPSCFSILISPHFLSFLTWSMSRARCGGSCLLSSAFRRQMQAILWVWGQLDLYAEFQASQGYTVRLCLKNKAKYAINQKLPSLTPPVTTSRSTNDPTKQTKNQNPACPPPIWPSSWTLLSSRCLLPISFLACLSWNCLRLLTLELRLQFFSFHKSTFNLPLSLWDHHHITSRGQRLPTTMPTMVWVFFVFRNYSLSPLFSFRDS